jgi:hypothetical protein
VNHLNETLADDGFHYAVQTCQPPKPEHMRPSWNAGSVRTNSTTARSAPRTGLYMMYMMTLPIHIGPYGMGRGDAMTPGIQEGRPHCPERDEI